MIESCLAIKRKNNTTYSIRKNTNTNEVYILGLKSIGKKVGFSAVSPERRLCLKKPRFAQPK